MKSKKKINKYFVGGTINDILGQADSILQLGLSPLQYRNAANGGDSVIKSIQGIASGAEAGAKLGSIIPGIGTRLGASIGATTGLIGSGGSVQNNTFYEDPTLNLGTGLVGAFKNKSLRKKYNEEKKRVAGNRYSLSNTQRLQSEWAEDYDDNVYTMANGGQIPSSLAYVDDGELITTPQGDILEVPENGNPTDSNLVNLPEGSKILSDTLKVPGTKKTFAQLGKDMMSKKKSINKGKYAENSAKLNQMNDTMIHDALFNFQEATKQNKMTKKYKNGIQAASDGDEITMSKAAEKALSRYPKRKYYRDKFGKLQYEPIPTAMDLNPNASADRVLTPMWSDNQFVPERSLPQYGTLNYNHVNYSKPVEDLSLDMATVQLPEVIVKPKSTVSNRKNSKNTVSNTPANNQVKSTVTYDNSIIPNIQGIKWQNFRDSIPTTITEQDRQRAVNNVYKPNNNGINKNNRIIDSISKFGNIVEKISPILSNMNSTPETFDTIDNPYSGIISDIASRRRFNIDPAIRSIKDNIAVSNYNADQMNPNTGANMAYRLQSAIAADKAISDLYSQKSNIDNQYKGDYANILNSLGQQNVAARNMSTDLNARSRAAARNINREALSQISNYAQNRRLMNNQKYRDMAMLDAYAPFLESIYKTEDYSNLMSKFRR